MTTSNLLGVASDESEDGLSREHSLGRDDQRLFSDTESVPSSNKGTATPEKTAFGEDEKCEVVTCAQPNDGEHLDDHHPSAGDRGEGERGGAVPKGILGQHLEGMGGLAVAGAMHNTLKVFALCLVRVSCSRPKFWAGRKFT